MHRRAPAVASVMKTAASLGLVSLLVTTVFAGRAFAGKLVNQDDNRADERTVFVTGSLIPQRIKRKPIGTTTVSPLRIIDRREIDQTGRRTTQGAFIADPSLRILGH